MLTISHKILDSTKLFLNPLKFIIYNYMGLDSLKNKRIIYQFQIFIFVLSTNTLNSFHRSAFLEYEFLNFSQISFII